MPLHPGMVIGLDLSGPSNLKDTALVIFERFEQTLLLRCAEEDVGDQEILQLVEKWSSDRGCAAGLDAPLSYNPGGGDRPGDRALRSRLVQAGLPSGSVMTPTMTRMAYLTLRGMAVARLLESRFLPAESLKIAEVHPGGALVLHGAPLEWILNLKRSPAAPAQLLDWLETRGLEGAGSLTPASDHLAAACAAALAAWKWVSGDPAWIHPADPPLHPFPIIC